MSTQLDGQLDLFDLLPLACQYCGEVCDQRRAYEVHNFPRFHTETMPGVCKEMAWAVRGYRHAVWAVENFGSWYELAQPGSEIWERQLLSMTGERDQFEEWCTAYTAQAGTQWLEVTA